jgi:integrase
MGRKGTGVEIRDKSIRLTFTFEGQPQRQTIMLNGVVMVPTVANIRYANKLAVEIRDKIAHDTFSMAEYFPASGAGGGLTVSAQLDTWLAAQRIEHSTRKGYMTCMRFWKAAIGDKLVRTLKPSHTMTVIAGRPDLSGKTINNYTSVLREALQLAVIDKILIENPIAKIQSATYQKPEPDPFTAEETERITNYMETKHPGHVANMVKFWLWTGLRSGELLGLHWTNVDITSGTILVAESRVLGIQKKSTKTNKARTVKLNSRAMAALQAQRALTQIQGEEVFKHPRYSTGWVNVRGFVLTYWAPALKVLGIRYRRPYDMRHTYATAMLMAGVNPSMAAKQMGHSVEIFLRTYAKWLDGTQTNYEMNKLEAAFGVPQKLKGVK